MTPQIRDERKAYAVIGMRRSGKTTYLWRVIADRAGPLSGPALESLVHIDFEDDRLLPMDASRLGRACGGVLIAPIRSIGQASGAHIHSASDEIQAVSGRLGRFVRRLIDTELVDIYLSGFLLRGCSHGRDSDPDAGGRVLEIRLFPFEAFREISAPSWHGAIAGVGTAYPRRTQSDRA